MVPLSVRVLRRIVLHLKGILFCSSAEKNSSLSESCHHCWSAGKNDSEWFPSLMLECCEEWFSIYMPTLFAGVLRRMVHYLNATLFYELCSLS